MKNLSFSLFNVISVFLIVLLIILIVIPFNLIDMEQAQRIAKWKTEYEQLNYCFELVNIHESSIIPTNEEAKIVVSDEYILERFQPYFNFKDNKFKELKKYKYRRLNSRPIKKDYKFYFDKFVTDNDGKLYSIKQNDVKIISEQQPLYFMFIDINGTEKPNKIGKDIFFISIYKNYAKALGYNRGHAKLKINCSPIGSGLYCSQYYLLGSKL